jgi:hypothetical protein
MIEPFLFICANLFLTGSTVSSCKMFSFLLWSYKLYPAVYLMNFTLLSLIFLYPIVSMPRFHEHIKLMG